MAHAGFGKGGVELRTRQIVTHMHQDVALLGQGADPGGWPAVTRINEGSGGGRKPERQAGEIRLEVPRGRDIDAPAVVSHALPAPNLDGRRVRHPAREYPAASLIDAEAATIFGARDEIRPEHPLFREQ